MFMGMIIFLVFIFCIFSDSESSACKVEKDNLRGRYAEIINFLEGKRLICQLFYNIHFCLQMIISLMYLIISKYVRK